MSLGVFTAGVSLVGTAMNIIGQLQAGQAAKEVSRRYNAPVAEMDAEAAEAATQDTLARLAIDRDRTLGTQAAGYSKGGVRLTGSPLLVMEETVRLANRDAAHARLTGDYAIAGARARAAYALYAGDVAERQGQIGAVGSLLTGLGSLGVSYLQGHYFGGGRQPGSQLALMSADRPLRLDTGVQPIRGPYMP